MKPNGAFLNSVNLTAGEPLVMSLLAFLNLLLLEHFFNHCTRNSLKKRRMQKPGAFPLLRFSCAFTGNCPLAALKKTELSPPGRVKSMCWRAEKVWISLWLLPWGSWAALDCSGCTSWAAGGVRVSKLKQVVSGGIWSLNLWLIFLFVAWTKYVSSVYASFL